MKIITIANHKGGAGKTSTAKHLAEYYANVLKKRTLLVDLDAQANLTTSYDVSVELSDKDNIYRLFDDKQPVTPRFIKKNLYIIPSNAKTSKINVLICGESNMLYILKDVLHSKTYTDIFDVCIIDCPPSVGYHVWNALIAATDIIIPLQPGKYSYDGLRDILQNVEALKTYKSEVHSISVLITMIFEKRKATQSLFAQLENDSIQPLVINSKIRYCEAFKQAELNRQTVWDLPNKNNAAADMTAVCIELTARIKNVK